MVRTVVTCCAALAAFAVEDAAHACACRGVGSPSAALTSSRESWGLSLTGSAELAHGVWDSDGRYHALGDGELVARETLGLTLAVRVHRDWEVGGGAELVAARLSTPTVADENAGLGDVRLRARWEVLDEPLPHETRVPWPAVALIGTISGGTGEASFDRAASTGLGTSEGAVALQLVRTLPNDWQLEGLAELAERAPDTSLGFERQLGLRALFELGLSQPVLPVLRLGGYTALRWEGDTSYRGELAAGSGQRSWTVSLFAVHELEPLNARTSLTLEHAPALDGVSHNALGHTGVSVALSFSR